jgi:Reverse transcriptase (RNA-dependent DNA polymerase)
VYIFVEVNKDLTADWIQRHPEVKSFLSDDGRMYLRIHRYMYGMQESPHEFNAMLDKELKKIGFQLSRADRCLYVKKDRHGQIIVSVHVDYMLVSSPNKKAQKEFENTISKTFEISVLRGTLSYLGMTIQRDQKGITVDQHGSSIKSYRNLGAATKAQRHNTRPSQGIKTSQK